MRENGKEAAIETTLSREMRQNHARKREEWREEESEKERGWRGGKYHIFMRVSHFR